MREALLQLPGLVFGRAAIGHVVDRADVLERSALRVARDLRDVVQVPRRPVVEHDTVLAVERIPGRIQFAERLVELFAVARVHPALEHRRQRQGFCGSVDVEDAAELRREVVGLGLVEVDDVVAEVGELLRQPQLGLAASQALVGEFAQRDVADEADEPGRHDALHPADRELARKDGTVLALRLHFPADADDPGFARVLVAVHVRVVLGTVGRGHQHVHVPADHLGGRVPEDPLRREAELLDPAAVVDDDDCIDRRIQQRLELELGLARASGRAVRVRCLRRRWAGDFRARFATGVKKVRILKERGARH